MKTKIIIAAIAVIVIVLAFLGIRYWDKFAPPIGETNEDTSSETEFVTKAEYTTKEGDTTVKPFVEARTEIITTAAETTAAQVEETTTKQPETAQLMGERAIWPTDEIFDGIPSPAKKQISNMQEYKTEKGRRFVIRLNKFSYNEFLSYIDKVEKAGFSDKNNRANAPEEEPAAIAMYYSPYDGTRSFGIYWHGEGSHAEFDCEIVVCDYDQAK